MSSSDRTNAPIDCPLKMSTIAWSKCEEYRELYGCLCKEARDRLRIKGEGQEAFEQKLRQIRQPVPQEPPGWRVERMSRFYVIYDDDGELRHRATNQAEADDYMTLVSEVLTLRAENRKLWKLLEEELIDNDDPWNQVDERITASEEQP